MKYYNKNLPFSYSIFMNILRPFQPKSYMEKIFDENERHAKLSEMERDQK